MTIRNLDKLFRPQSVAVIGASNRERSVGATVMHNLLNGGFQGPIMPVNPNEKAVAGVLSYTDIADLPHVPDLAVVCTPPLSVPGIIAALGDRGTGAAAILTAGLSRHETANGETLIDAALTAARARGLRILGPNCLGLLVPGIGLNASFAHLSARPGKIAFVSQSGALCTSVLDWAEEHDIGFSHFISLGDSADVDFGDVINYLGSDPGTRSILLYIEAIHERRDFMSAARAAARNKPVLVIKSGRVAEGAKAAHSHTGALAGSDDVYDAAIRRAGMLRVDTVEDLFSAVETLARARPLDGERLAILSNGGGIGVLAVDNLVRHGGVLARLSEKTLQDLDAVLPATWPRGNPVDIIGDAPATRYAQALTILTDADEVDAVLVMHAPTAIVSSSDAAQAVIDTVRKKPATVLTSWVGGKAVSAARQLFSRAGLPTYDTPEQAVGAFLHMVNYKRNQQQLMETPPSAPREFTADIAAARRVIDGALRENRLLLSEPESKTVLTAYGIPTVETHIVASAEEAVIKAIEMGFPVALKILSPNVSHKSDVGGVDLFLESAEAVLAAARSMPATILEHVPDARIEGFSVQKMAERPGAYEVIAGIATDPIFGPVVLFGQGGTAVEIIGDRAVALPPLNLTLARELVFRTRISKLFPGYRDRPPIHMDSLCLMLMQVSQLIVDIPAIVEMDINPLLVDETGVLALDARIKLTREKAPADRLSIRPYPKELEEWTTLKSGRKILLRPIRPEDEPEHYDLFSKFTPEDIRFRFFDLIRQLPHSEMARYTQIDYDREMAFIASAARDDGGRETLGVVRTITDPDNERAEFAIIVRSDIKGQGLGETLMKKIIAYSRERGTGVMTGQVLQDNQAMLDLAERLGFTHHALADEPNIVEVTLPLQP
ncbi:MAG: bifunctional acetate--CoA ligase family protein/GNAT family N-acetyltransferase [Rhodospirillales bacterium]